MDKDTIRGLLTDTKEAKRLVDKGSFAAITAAKEKLCGIIGALNMLLVMEKGEIAEATTNEA